MADRRIALATSLALAAIATLIYLRTLTFGFVYDDLPQVVNNPLLERPDIWLLAFVEDVWSHHLIGAQYYRPVFTVWLALNHAGFELSAWGWHLSSVLVHAVVGVLVFWVGLRLGLDRFAAIIAAGLFAAHPVHVESVAWVSGVTDPLMTACLLGCLLLHLQWRGGVRSSWPVAPFAWLAFAGALLSKETAVVFVAVLALLSFLAVGYRRAWEPSLGARCREALLATAPYVVITGLYLGVRAVTVGAVGLDDRSALHVELLGAPSLLWQYSVRLFWPVNLSPIYPVGYVQAFSVREVVWPLVAVSGLCVASLWASHARSRVLLLLALIALPLAPVLLVSKLPLDDFFHDRYLYLPSVGFCLLAATWITHIPAGGVRLFGRPALQLAVALLLVGAGALTAVTESTVWRDDLTLFARAAECAPENNVALSSYAATLLIHGDISKAQALYEQVHAFAPDYWEALYGLGRVHFLQADYANALGWLERARDARPQDADQYVHLGYSQLHLGRPRAAEKSFRRSIALRPLGAGARYALGVALEAQERLPEALEAFEQELAMQPDEPRVRARVDALTAKLLEKKPSSQ